MKVSCRLCAALRSRTVKPSTRARLARSAAGSALAFAIQNRNRSRSAVSLRPQARPGAIACAYTPISSSLLSPRQPPLAPFEVRPPLIGSSAKARP
jgi:hypothetical protein